MLHPVGPSSSRAPVRIFLAEICDCKKCCQISSFHSPLSLKQFSIDHATWSSIETLFPCAGRFQYKEFNFENVSVGYASLHSQDHQSGMIVESNFSKADKLYVYFQRAFWVELLETAIECTVKCIGCVRNPFGTKFANQSSVSPSDFCKIDCFDYLGECFMQFAWSRGLSVGRTMIESNRPVFLRPCSEA